MRIPQTRGWGVALAFAAACISGVAVFVNGLGVAMFEDATVYTTAKNGVAAVVLVALLGAGRARAPDDAPRRRPSPGAWAGLAALGLVGGSVPFVLFFEGLARASSTEAAFIHKTLVVWVAVLAVPLLRERLSPLHVAAIASLLAGQALLGGGPGALPWGSGETMILAATLLWAVEFVLAKRLLRDLFSLVVGTARMGIGLVVLLGWLAVTGRLMDLVVLTAPQWGWAVTTGVVLGAFVATWYAALARAQAVDAAAVLVFGAVITALLSLGVQGVGLPAARSLGLLLVTAGAAAAAGGALRAGIFERRVA